MSGMAPHRAPIDTLRDEHAMILRALAQLEGLGQAVKLGGGADETVSGWLRDVFSGFVDRCHHAKEEQHLFPALQRHGIPTEGGPLGLMLCEHEEGRVLLATMATGHLGQRAEAIRGYGRLLRAHLDKENYILFPLAEHVLSEDEQRDLAIAFDALERRVAGPGAYELILKRLAELER